MNRYFVTAIGTDSGKTVASAILCEALKADYWKPIQAGLPTDSDVIRTLTDRQTTTVHKERHVLKTPASPHAAAKLEGINIRLDDFVLPITSKALVVEGAGGLMVPLNDHQLVADLIEHLALEVIVVSNFYLGSINHTLLTLEAIRHRNIKLCGIIFNGPENRESERIISLHANAPTLLKVGQETVIDRNTIINYSKIIKKNLA